MFLCVNAYVYGSMPTPVSMSCENCGMCVCGGCVCAYVCTCIHACTHTYIYEQTLCKTDASSILLNAGSSGNVAMSRPIAVSCNMYACVHLLVSMCMYVYVAVCMCMSICVRTCVTRGYCVCEAQTHIRTFVFEHSHTQMRVFFSSNAHAHGHGAHIPCHPHRGLQRDTACAAQRRSCRVREGPCSRTRWGHRCPSPACNLQSQSTLSSGKAHHRIVCVCMHVSIPCMPSSVTIIKKAPCDIPSDRLRMYVYVCVSIFCIHEIFNHILYPTCSICLMYVGTRSTCMTSIKCHGTTHTTRTTPGTPSDTTHTTSIEPSTSK